MKTKIAFAGLLLGLLVAAAFFLRQLAHPHVAAKAALPNGSEMYVVQTFNWNLGERFTTSFYLRSPAGLWGWCYYSHQDEHLWAGRVALDLDVQRATVFREGKPTIIFDWETQTYRMPRFGRTVVGAPDWRPPGWTPEWWTPALLKKK